MDINKMYMVALLTANGTHSETVAVEQLRKRAWALDCHRLQLIIGAGNLTISDAKESNSIWLKSIVTYMTLHKYE